jgi:hypothetical protein
VTPPDDAPVEAHERLARWPTRLRLMIALAAGLMLVALAGFALGEPAWQAPVGSLALAVLLIAGISAQTAVRCPRCNRPLPLRSWFRLPDRCRRCGLPLVEGA